MGCRHAPKATLAGFFIHSSRLNFIHYAFIMGKRGYRLALSLANALMSRLEARFSSAVREAAAADVDGKC
jgi:hypothetical protein